MLPGKGAHRVLWAASMAIAVLVAWAVITSPASGKEPSRVVFCGKSARSAVVDRAVLRLPVDDVPPTTVPPWSQRLRWFMVRSEGADDRGDAG